MFRFRPSSRADEQAVLRMLATRAAVDRGATTFLRTQLLDQWRISEFDPAADAVVVEEDGSTLGYAALFGPGALAFVNPGHERRGIGSGLLRWVEKRARERSRSVHRQPVAEHNESGRALLEGAGYRHVRSVAMLARSLCPPRAIPALPDGITLHELDVTKDASALHAADAAAFADNPEAESEDLHSFYDEHLAAPELAPGLSLVARRGATVAGFVVSRTPGEGIGYIDLLGVVPHERQRGLGRVLLLNVFARFADAGLGEAQLEVASDNPRALRLYEQAGMTVSYRIGVFEKAIPPSTSVRSP